MISCDCAKDCPVCTGEAVYMCKRRSGGLVNLCSRCNLSSDEIVGRLFTEDDIPRLAKLDEDTGPGENPIAQVADVMVNALGGADALLRRGLDHPYRGSVH